MRVVIADDEKFVLVVLKSALQSVRFPIEIVGEALDGDEAYRLCCEKKPELLITDICMPRKDGLDLLAKLRETQPELPVIIYSGFDNFSYAQKAIHYGVEEYLLKPIDEEKLERAISDVMQRRKMLSQRDKMENRNRLLARCLAQIASGSAGRAWQDGGDEDVRQFLAGTPACTLVMLRLPGGQAGSQEQWRACFAEHTPYAWHMDAPEGRITVLETQDTAGAARRAADAVWNGKAYLCCQQELSRLVDDGAEPGEQLAQLCTALRRADDTLQSWFYGGEMREGAVYDNHPETKEAEQFNRGYADRITTAILLGKKEYLATLLRDYWQALLKAYPAGSPSCLKRAAWEQMNRQMAALKLSWDACPQAAAAHDALVRLLTAEQVLEKLLTCGSEILELQKKCANASPEENLREVIDKYLHEHYREDISLDQLADYLHFNSSYTSDLFKRIFGKPFVSYLTAMRVETAKVLLDSGKFKTYEVAERVGYQDEKYFFKTFKKVTGFTPKEYRKQHMKQ